MAGARSRRRRRVTPNHAEPELPLTLVLETQFFGGGPVTATVIEFMRNDIKYVERKVDGLRGVGRIARVAPSGTGRTIYLDGRELRSHGGYAAKVNYHDADTFEEYWISNPRRDGNDSLFPAIIAIDDDVREYYWLEIRHEPSKLSETIYRSAGRPKRDRDRLEKAIRRHDMDRRFRAP